MYHTQGDASQMAYCIDSNRLEIITTCVGFDDILEFALAHNHMHADNYIVVTSHDDVATQNVCKKFSVKYVPTDLFNKHGRPFNKGAGLNAGWFYFQYNSWRLHIDVDTILPDNFRRMLFNHTHLDTTCLYGADRFDIIGYDGLDTLRDAENLLPQVSYYSGVSPAYGGRVHCDMPTSSSARFVHKNHGYVPIGCFQLWHADKHPVEYAYSKGTAANDDLAFAIQWPEANRRLLPSVFIGHLNANYPFYSQNWTGRKSPRIEKPVDVREAKRMGYLHAKIGKIAPDFYSEENLKKAYNEGAEKAKHD